MILDRKQLHVSQEFADKQPDKNTYHLEKKSLWLSLSLWKFQRLNLSVEIKSSNDSNQLPTQLYNKKAKIFSY